ncbi:MAG: hypothetical protein K6B68_05510 [Eubacterium sp.]|nr:hypothetical protein [Eubacterium sp.]
MLTISVNEKKFIYLVCKTTGDISCGEVFEIIKIANEWDVRFGYHAPIPRTKIICCGDLNANQKSQDHVKINEGASKTEYHE